MGQVIYQSSEKVVIKRELEKDYLIEDMATGKQYLIDKSYFRKRYEEVEEKPAQ